MRGVRKLVATPNRCARAPSLGPAKPPPGNLDSLQPVDKQLALATDVAQAVHSEPAQLLANSLGSSDPLPLCMGSSHGVISLKDRHARPVVIRRPFRTGAGP